jgi:ABC-type Fe3+/spermidine/putrescine transport system ATPase subunit
VSLRFEHVSVAYGGIPALTDITLDVATGETVAVLGPSGSGKSTLLRAAAGLEPVASGSVSLEGVDLTGVPIHERGFGVVFQSYALFEHLDVAGNVAFGLRMRGVPLDAVDDALTRVGLAGFGGRPVDTLSGGERQRVALARALVIDPPVLLLDEPLGAIDVAMKTRLLDDLDGIVADRTTVYVTHDHDEALTIGDRVAVLRDGRLVAVDTPEGLWSHPPDPWTARFLGHPNVYEGPNPFGEPPLAVPIGNVTVGDGTKAVVTRSRFAGDGWRIEATATGVPVVFAADEGFSPGTEVEVSASATIPLGRAPAT